MSDEAGGIRFTRRPYNVSYIDLKGEKQTIRRRPPEKLHPMLPTDVVSLNRKKNDDFRDGDEFSVKHINPRHPNTLQIEDDDGRSTFVDYYDLDLEEEVALRNGVDPRDREINNKYLLWP